MKTVEILVKYSIKIDDGWIEEIKRDYKDEDEIMDIIDDNLVEAIYDRDCDSEYINLHEVVEQLYKET